MIVRSKPTQAVKNLVRHAQNMLVKRGADVADIVQRATVSALGTADVGFVGQGETLVPLVEEAVLLTLLPNARRTPTDVHILNVTGGAVGSAIAEKKPFPVVRATLDRNGLKPRKFGALTVASRESVLAGGAVFELALQNDLIRAVADTANAALLSDAAESNAVPAGLAYGVIPVDATSDPVADIRALFAALGPNIDPASLMFATDFNTAVRLSTATDANGGLLFPNVTAAGGELLGVPLRVSRSSPLDGSPATGSLYLIDGSAVNYALDGVEVSTTEHASIEMSDAPTGDGDAPASASVAIVSLFQNELEGFKIVLRATWKVSRAGSVAVLTGIDY